MFLIWDRICSLLWLRRLYPVYKKNLFGKLNEGMKLKAIKLFPVLEFIWFHKCMQKKCINIYVLTGTIPANHYNEFFLYLLVPRECERGRFTPGLSYSSLTGQEGFCWLLFEVTTCPICESRIAHAHTNTVFATFC